VLTACQRHEVIAEAVVGWTPPIRPPSINCCWSWTHGRTRPSSAPTPCWRCRWRSPAPRPTRASLPLFRYLGGVNARVLPVPLMNVINGGQARRQHHRLPGVHDRARRRRLVHEALRMGASVPQPEEGAARPAPEYDRPATRAASPNLKSPEEALDVLCKAVEQAGYKLGEQIASPWTGDDGAYEEAKQKGKTGYCFFQEQPRPGRVVRRD